MLNESIEFDLKVNGKDAETNIKDVEKAQEDLDKTTEKTSKNIEANWTKIGAAAAVVVTAMGAMMKQSVDLERATFGLTQTTKDYIKAASEQYGMSQEVIAGFVKTGKTAGMTGVEIKKMVDQAIALGRAYPHESTESFIDNLTQLSRTGEAQGYIVDILEQKYGLLDQKLLTTEQKMEAVEEATKGVNERFNETRAAGMDKTFQEVKNMTIEMGNALWDIAESSGALWAVQKGFLAVQLAANGYLKIIAAVKASSVGGFFGADVGAASEDLARIEGNIDSIMEKISGAAEIRRPAALSGGASTVESLLPTPDITGTEKASKEWVESIEEAHKKAETSAKKTSKKIVATRKETADESLEINQDMIDDMEDQNQQYADMANTLTSGLTSGIIEFTETGKANFKDMTNSIIQDMLQIQIRASMMNLFGGFGGDSGGILGGAFNMLLNAKGNAFSNGQVTPFASGGVVSSPTIFPMANGMGLMGEEGAEAIMPLSRTSSGDLGVKSTPPVVNVNVQNYGNDNVEVQQNGDNIQVIISQIASSIARGTGDVGKAIEGRYGLQKR